MPGQMVLSAVDDRVIEVVNQVRPEVESQLNEKFSVFKPVEVARQVVGVGRWHNPKVAGLNYFVKVQIGDNNAVFLRMYVVREILNHRYDRFSNVSLVKVVTGKTLDDPLTYF